MTKLLRVVEDDWSHFMMEVDEETYEEWLMRELAEMGMEADSQAVLFPADLGIKSAGNLGCPTGNLVDLSHTFVAI